MKLVSDSCKCSACLHKYCCKDYKKVIRMQSLAADYLSCGNKNISILFQVEKCENRQVRKNV